MEIYYLVWVWGMWCVTAWTRWWLCSKSLCHVLWETCRMTSGLGHQRRDAFSQLFLYERNSWGARTKGNFLLVILHSYTTGTLEGGKKHYLIPGSHDNGKGGYYWHCSQSIILLFYVSVCIARWNWRSLLPPPCIHLTCSDKLCLDLRAELVFHFEL